MMERSFEKGLDVRSESRHPTIMVSVFIISKELKIIRDQVAVYSISTLKNRARLEVLEPVTMVARKAEMSSIGARKPQGSRAQANRAQAMREYFQRWRESQAAHWYRAMMSQ